MNPVDSKIGNLKDCRLVYKVMPPVKNKMAIENELKPTLIRGKSYNTNRNTIETTVRIPSPYNNFLFIFSV
jgi:hypothetical protein